MGGRTMHVDWPHQEPHSPATLRAATLTVCEAAHDAADALVMLRAVGLIGPPTKPEIPPSIHDLVRDAAKTLGITQRAYVRCYGHSVAAARSVIDNPPPPRDPDDRYMLFSQAAETLGLPSAQAYCRAHGWSVDRARKIIQRGGHE